jgi:hypothetical protein
VRTVVLILALLSTSWASAGTCKLNWTHGYLAEDGSTVTLTGFNFYWRVNNGPEQRIQYYPPMPLPYKVENGVYFWAKTFVNDAWTPGATVCFTATAVAGPLESNRSGQVCKTMPADPTAPNIIDITNP